MNRCIHRLGVLAALLTLLVTSGDAMAKPPAEQALRQYAVALQQLVGTLSKIDSPQAAQAAVPALTKQVADILALKEQLSTKAEGDPNQKPSKNEEATSHSMKQLSETLRQSATALSQQLQRLYADPDIAKILVPVLSKLAS